MNIASLVISVIGAVLSGMAWRWAYKSAEQSKKALRSVKAQQLVASHARNRSDVIVARYQHKVAVEFTDKLRAEIIRANLAFLKAERAMIEHDMAMIDVEIPAYDSSRDTEMEAAISAAPVPAAPGPPPPPSSPTQ